MSGEQLVPWYAIQIRTGHERDMLNACRHVVLDTQGEPTESWPVAEETDVDGTDRFGACSFRNGSEEVFQFLAARQYRHAGDWTTEYERIFPGYIFFATEDPESLYFRLKRIPALTKLIRSNKDFCQVSPEDRVFLSRAGGENHVIEVSRGVRQGEEIMITDGPLKGFPGRIVRFDIHKHKAYVEVTLFGRKQRVSLSIDVLTGGSYLRKD